MSLPDVEVTSSLRKNSPVCVNVVLPIVEVSRMTIAHVLAVVTTVFTVVQFILVYKLCMYLVAYSPVFRYVVSAICPVSVVSDCILVFVHMCCFLSVSSLCHIHTYIQTHKRNNNHII